VRISKRGITGPVRGRRYMGQPVGLDQPPRPPPGGIAFGGRVEGGLRVGRGGVWPRGGASGGKVHHGGRGAGAARIARQVMWTGPGRRLGRRRGSGGEHALGWHRPPRAAAGGRPEVPGGRFSGCRRCGGRDAYGGLGLEGGCRGTGRRFSGCKALRRADAFCCRDGEGAAGGRVGPPRGMRGGAGRGGEDTHRRGDRLALWVYGLRRGFCVGGLLRPGAGLPGWRGRQGYPAADERGQGFRSGWMLA